MSPKRPEFADCLASPSPRTRGLAMPILGFLLCGQLTGCFLIPTVAVSDCVCDMGQICNADKVCQNGVDDPPPTPQDAACIYNHDCDGSVCEYDSANIMANRCLSMDMLVFVGDPSNCNNVTADGTRQNPYCTINKAIDVVTTSGSGQAIRLLADVNYGSIDSSKFTGKSLTIYGPYEPEPGVNPLSRPLNLIGTTTPAVSVRGDKTALILDGLSISTNDVLAEGAIFCENFGKIVIHRSLVIGAKAWGLSSKNSCSYVGIDRVQFYRNYGAVSLANTAEFSVSNSIFSFSDRRMDPVSAIMVNSSVGMFNHVTVYQNPSSVAGAFIALNLNNNSVRIISSIVANNSLAGYNNSQFDPVPPTGSPFYLQDVTLGDLAQAVPMGVGVRKLSPAFVNDTSFDFRLSADASKIDQNRACCIEQANRQLSVSIDLFGQARKEKTELGAIGR